jgi:hypothetical protein
MTFRFLGSRAVSSVYRGFRGLAASCVEAVTILRRTFKVKVKRESGVDRYMCLAMLLKLVEADSGCTAHDSTRFHPRNLTHATIPMYRFHSYFLYIFVLKKVNEIYAEPTEQLQCTARLKPKVTHSFHKYPAL